MTAIQSQANLRPGWYAIGFAGIEDGGINWNGAPVFKYLGDGAWEDEDGRPIEGFFDPELQMTVTTDSADAYMPQN